MNKDASTTQYRQLGPEGVGVLVLQRVEEARVPVVDQLGDVDDEMLSATIDRQQAARDPGTP